MFGHHFVLEDTSTCSGIVPLEGGGGGGGVHMFGSFLRLKRCFFGHHFVFGVIPVARPRFNTFYHRGEVCNRLVLELFDMKSSNISCT